MTSTRFSYPVDACDVHDCLGLVAYRACRERWLHWIEADRHHSINRQLYGMMWDDAAFRALNEARRFATKDSPTAAVAPLLAGLIDQGFIATQVLAISRLVDGRNDVISLRRLLDDIEAHAHLLTRENFVCHDGLPFDPEAAQAAYWQRVGLPASGQVGSLPTQGPDAFDFSSMAHEVFDRVAGAIGSTRARSDRLGPDVFARLRSLLEAPEVNSIKTLRHKFVAHAADVNSRQKAGIDRFGITLNQLEAAQKTLVQAAQRIELDLLWGSGRGVVPVPQYDHLAHLGLPVVPEARMQELYDWWHRHCDSREAWTSTA
jgi:hypothetical protein